MNIYTLNFNFKECDFEIHVTANQLANASIPSNSKFDEFYHNGYEFFMETIRVNSDLYFVTIDNEYPGCVSVYNVDAENGVNDDVHLYQGTLCENNIPYICTKIIDSESNCIIYER